VTLVETQHRLALEQLRRGGERPVSLAALRAAGLDAPAAVISELELLTDPSSNATGTGFEARASSRNPSRAACAR